MQGVASGPRFFTQAEEEAEEEEEDEDAAVLQQPQQRSALSKAIGKGRPKSWKERLRDRNQAQQQQRPGGIRCTCTSSGWL